MHCRPMFGSVVVYSQEHHLTRTYTNPLTSYLKAALLKVPALASTAK